MESKIQSQPMLPSETGATQGSRISRRTTHFPRKSFCSETARMVARKMTTTREAIAKRKVFLFAIASQVVVIFLATILAVSLRKSFCSETARMVARKMTTTCEAIAKRNTFLFAIASRVVVIFLATILAVSLQKDFRGKWIVRLLILLPWVAPVSLGSIGWLWILDSIYSVINYGLYHWLHVCGPLPGMTPCPVWLGQPALAMASIIAVQVWRTLPLATVINLGGLTSIPQDIHDAAAIDGAGFFRTLFQITIPLEIGR